VTDRDGHEERDEREEEGADAGPAPISELADLEIETSAELGGRVQRDINRRTLAADSLDFSFTVMLQIFWEHLRTVIESWPGTNAESETKTPPADD